MQYYKHTEYNKYQLYVYSLIFIHKKMYLYLIRVFYEIYIYGYINNYLQLRIQTAQIVEKNKGNIINYLSANQLSTNKPPIV